MSHLTAELDVTHIKVFKLPVVLLALLVVLSIQCGDYCASDDEELGYCCQDDRSECWPCCFSKSGLRLEEDYDCCPPPGSRSFSLSSIPAPDLSNTNLDGLVDFGRTTLKVKTADGDSLETKLKGRVAIVGGVCPDSQCPLQVVLAELRPIQDKLTSAKGKSVSGVFVRNANTWTGTRLEDATITMDSTNKLAMEAIVERKRYVGVINPTTEFKGALYYNVSRTTDTGPRINNRIEITGHFADEDEGIDLTLTISIWATNCQPTVQPKAQCRPNIESGLPGYVHFDSDFEMLGNLQSSQDLCDALLAPKYEDVCTSGGNAEFPTFTCKKQPISSSTNKVEAAKLLKFYWKDANGIVFSNEYTANLDQMPVFPVTLTVENKWGRTVSATLDDAPVCSSDVALAPGACAWEQVPQSHQQSDAWCPEGSFLTALDLEGDTNASVYDAPLVDYARCCAPRNTQPIEWESCSWQEVGRRSHQQGENWCPANAYLTALDLDGDTELSAHDSPIVGRAQCCTPAVSIPTKSDVCPLWVEVGRRSLQRGENWCPADAFLTALDLDGDTTLSAHDSPIVGRAQCCGMAPLELSQIYVVQADDWLSKLAEKSYGDSSAWPAIWRATNIKATEDSSISEIVDPSAIEIGQRLWIPNPDEVEQILVETTVEED